VSTSIGYDHVATECVCCGGKEFLRSQAVLMPFLAHRVYQWEPAKIDDSWGLNTISAGNAYALCNSLLCMKCSLLFLDIRFSTLEMARLYDNYRDERYTQLRDHYEPGYRARSVGLTRGGNYRKQVEAFLTPHLPNILKVLDWGGDTGENTPFKDNPDNTVHIYDISGIKTVGKAIQISKQVAYQEKYDLIVCSNVLEHVPYPRQLLIEIKAVMTTSTLLYIEVPLESLIKEFSNDPQLINKKRHWHEHINFFTADSLKALVTILGLSLLNFQVQEIISEGKTCSQFMLACILKDTLRT
jgi:hypothetical protein